MRVSRKYLVRLLLQFVTFALVIHAAPIIKFSSDIEHVVLIGVDGFNLTPDCVPAEQAPLIWPNLYQRLFWEGVWSTKVRATTEAVSAPGWSSILCGLMPSQTGILSNNWVPDYDKARITPITEREPFPCLFDQIDTCNPDFRTIALYSWDWLNYIIPENALDLRLFCEDNYAACDESLTEIAIQELENKPNLLFLYYADLDGTGHRKQFCGEEYFEYAAVVDGYIGELLDALEANEMENNTMVIVTSDHGAVFGTRLHGLANDNNLWVPTVFRGPGIPKNETLPADTMLIDIAPVILSLFDCAIPSSWRGKPPVSIGKH